MRAVKKVEIIIDSFFLERVLSLLDDLEIPGYTVFKDIVGKGDREKRFDDEVSGAFKNSCILVACSEAEAEKIVEIIQPVLEKRGGICLVSNAEWVVHRRKD